MASAVPAAVIAGSFHGLHWTGLSRSSRSSSRQARNCSSRVQPVAPLVCVASAGKIFHGGSSDEREHRELLPAAVVNRREALSLCGLAATLSLLPACGEDTTTAAHAASLPEEDKPRLCDANCEKDLDKIPTQTTPSGLQFKDIVNGKGPSPPKGFQVAANYVAMIPTGKVFDSSLEKDLPYIFRVGAGQVIKGLDEGIQSMKVGGRRRLLIPGPLAFPNGLSSAAGRPRVPPKSPVIFDVDLLYIPGLEDEMEEVPSIVVPEVKSDMNAPLPKS